MHCQSISAIQPLCLPLNTNRSISSIWTQPQRKVEITTKRSLSNFNCNWSVMKLTIFCCHYMVIVRRVSFVIEMKRRQILIKSKKLFVCHQMQNWNKRYNMITGLYNEINKAAVITTHTTIYLHNCRITNNQYYDW